MPNKSQSNIVTTESLSQKVLGANVIENIYSNSDDLTNLFLQFKGHVLIDILRKVAAPEGKKSFLVFKHNKYFIIKTDNIAYFYVKNDLPLIKCFNQQEYFLNLSLRQLQNLVSNVQFYRINRQYLINFDAVNEVEHYLSRKLLVNLVIPTRDRLLVTKERTTDFLDWLNNR
jgi:DNA-binding LytR/AlgR family response regulator